MTPTMNRINRPSTSNILFFLKKEATLSTKKIIINAPVIIAVAMITNSSVNAIATSIESKENIKFMRMIERIIELVDFGFLSPSSRVSRCAYE